MKNFIKDAAERALKTAAQTGIAMIGTSTMIGEIDWAQCLSAVVVATLLSVLTSIASVSHTGGDTASLVNKKEENK